MLEQGQIIQKQQLKETIKYANLIGNNKNLMCIMVVTPTI